VIVVTLSGCATLDPPAGSSADGDGSTAGASAPAGLPAPPTVPDALPAAGISFHTVDEHLPAVDDGPPADLWQRVRRGFELGDHERARIERERRRFAGSQAYFDRLIERGEPYLYSIVEAIDDRDLPTDLLLVPVVESAFRPFAYSHGRAGGIWQFQPATGRRFGLVQDWWYDGRRDVLASTEAALDYLEYLHGFFDGDWLLAIAAYNAGEGTVQRAVRANAARGRPTDFWNLPLPGETRKYVPRILALRDIVAAPSEYGIALRPVANEPRVEVVELAGQIDLALVAEMTGLSVDAIYRLNPAFNRWATRPDGPHRIVVPVERAERLRRRLAERDPASYVQWQRHEVQPGETLTGIARRYGTRTQLLREVNDLAGSMIRSGSRLLVPVADRPPSAYALSAENRRRAIRSRERSGRERLDHRVAAGDTLWEVSRQYGVSVRELASWNGMAPADTLNAGDRLAVWVEREGHGGPTAAERLQVVRYEVESGDSLWRIARQFNVRVVDIRRWNGLDSGAVLRPGQELELRVDVTEQAGSI